eukprot:scaffold28661_cov33-Tisochrysis_lutea.AAC.1
MSDACAQDESRGPSLRSKAPRATAMKSCMPKAPDAIGLKGRAAPRITIQALGTARAKRS